MSVIEIGGWKAKPHPEFSGFEIYDPRGEYRGFAPNEASAREWLAQSSGVAYQKLPAIKLEQLRIERGIQRRIWQGWFRLNHYYLAERLLGTVQTKHQNKRTEVMTIAGDAGVIGYNLRWMLRVNGFRLED